MTNHLNIKGMPFTEIRKFSQPSIWFVLSLKALTITGELIFWIYRQIIQGQKFGNHPMSDDGLIASYASVPGLFIILFPLIGFS